VIEGLPQIGVSMLALNGDAEQPGKAGEEVGVSELTVVTGYKRIWRSSRWCRLMSPSPLIMLHDTHSPVLPCHLIFALGLVIRTSDPHIQVYPDQPSRLVGCAETSNERALHVQISAVSRESNRVR
jgi:hypothetical protein